MNWPFVSRTLHDAALATITRIEHENQIGRIESSRWFNHYEDLLERERAERADLLARYHALKLNGASTPEPTPAIPVKPVDPVLSAINDASAGKDAKVRVGMTRQAAVDKEAGLKPEDIILRIQRGNRPAEEVG